MEPVRQKTLRVGTQTPVLLPTPSAIKATEMFHLKHPFSRFKAMSLMSDYRRLKLIRNVIHV